MKHKTNREIGDDYEEEIAKELGAKLIPGSGSIREKKEDLDFPKMRMQVKYTSKKSLSVKAEDLAKLRENALNCGKAPAYFFSVDTEEWVAFPLWLIKNLEWFRNLRSPKNAEK